MADAGEGQSDGRGASRPKGRWRGVVLVGLLLNALYILAYLATGIDLYLPTLLILGVFLVPVAFVVYLVDRLPQDVIPLSVLAWCAFWSGIIAPLIAGPALTGADLAFGATLGWLGIGLIEESIKLVVPLWFYFRGRYRSEAAGLLIGVSAGLGFAVMESMGYGLRAVLEAEDDIIGPLEASLLVRALLSPAGHIAWTGIICAVLWRERERAGRATFNLKVLATFVVVILLHDLWDLGIFVGEGGPEELGLVTSSEVADLAGVGTLIAAILSLVLFFYRLREARRALAASASEVLSGGPSAPTEGRPKTK
ncbi:MAG: PrsW family intramembrane metalloprotease [Actinomycetota bacterium]|nr:PrsW family intramembrane metalloprotease [Actinomycetota bacterium]